MSEMGDFYRDVREYKKDLRRAYGMPCPGCAIKRPKADPTIMLPGQTCKVDGYVDPRPRLTKAQLDAIARGDAPVDPGPLSGRDSANEPRERDLPVLAGVKGRKMPKRAGDF